MIPSRFQREQHGADALEEGYFLIQPQGRVAIPVRIWFGPPQEDGVELDRSPRWQVQVGFDVLDNEPVRVGPLRIEHLTDIWPACGKRPTDRDDWLYRLERHEWAAAYDPDDAFGDIGRRVDVMSVTLP